jgi:hypothetical protein
LSNDKLCSFGRSLIQGKFGIWNDEQNIDYYQICGYHSLELPFYDIYGDRLNNIVKSLSTNELTIEINGELFTFFNVSKFEYNQAYRLKIKILKESKSNEKPVNQIDH